MGFPSPWDTSTIQHYTRGSGTSGHGFPKPMGYVCNMTLHPRFWKYGGRGGRKIVMSQRTRTSGMDNISSVHEREAVHMKSQQYCHLSSTLTSTTSKYKLLFKNEFEWRYHEWINNTASKRHGLLSKIFSAWQRMSPYQSLVKKDPRIASTVLTLIMSLLLVAHCKWMIRPWCWCHSTLQLQDMKKSIWNHTICERGYLTEPGAFCFS